MPRTAEWTESWIWKIVLSRRISIPVVLFPANARSKVVKQGDYSDHCAEKNKHPDRRVIRKRIDARVQVDQLRIENFRRLLQTGSSLTNFLPRLLLQLNHHRNRRTLRRLHQNL